MTSRFLENNTYLLYCFLIIASIVLSVWAVLQGNIINPDGTCYLLSAEIMKTSFHDAMHVCGQAKWPFYAFLIHHFTEALSLTYPQAAYILNGCFSLISVLMFVLITKSLGGSHRVLWFAALVILSAHQFNSIRQYIVRDHGFWAFYLISLFFLVRFYHRPKPMLLMASSLSLIVATLFRIEGAAFLLGLPCLNLMISKENLSKRLIDGFWFNLPLLIIIASAVMIGFMIDSEKIFTQWGRIHEIKDQMLNGLSFVMNRYTSIKTSLLTYVLPHTAARDVGMVMLCLFPMLYLINIINNLSLINVVLLLYAIYRRLLPFKTEAMRVLGAYLLINIVVTFVFFAEQLFLSKRYLIALSLILMLFVPFSLDDLWQRRHRLYGQFIFYFAISCLLLTSLGGIFNFGYSKSYLPEAGAWINQHVPLESELYSNDLQLMYYSRHFGNNLFNALNYYRTSDAWSMTEWRKYDYAALRVRAKEADKILTLQSKAPFKVVQLFKNKRGDAVIIFKNKIAIK